MQQQRHPFNGPLSGTTHVSQYQKGKTNLDLLEQETVSGSGTSWTICKSAPCPRQITILAPHHLVSYRPGALSATNQRRYSTDNHSGITVIITLYWDWVMCCVRCWIDWRSHRLCLTFVDWTRQSAAMGNWHGLDSCTTHCGAWFARQRHPRFDDFHDSSRCCYVQYFYYPTLAVADAWDRVISGVCDFCVWGICLSVCVCALKGKWVELSTPNLV